MNSVNCSPNSSAPPPRPLAPIRAEPPQQPHRSNIAQVSILHHHHHTHNSKQTHHSAMPFLRPSSSALRASRCLANTSHSALPSSSKAMTPAAAAMFWSSSRAQAADHAHDAHEDQYDPPSGWLWGVKPGEKYQKEGWEGVWVWGFFGSLGLGVVAYAFKPDTSYVLFCFVYSVFATWWEGGGGDDGLVDIGMGNVGWGYELWLTRRF
jgi:hypothetical protein